MVQLISKEEIKNETVKQEYKPPQRYNNEKRPFKKNGRGGGGGGFKPRPPPKSALDGFIGRDIKVKMRDGTYENGKLELIYQYEIVIIGDGGLPQIIYKHAIDSIKLKV